MNVRSWETLVLSILKLSLLSTAGITTQLKISLTDSKKKIPFFTWIMKPRGLKFVRYAAIVIYLNEYWCIFPKAKASESFCVMELNEIILNSMPHRWINQAYVQGFGF